MNEPTQLPSLLDGQESEMERRLYNARHGLADEARGHNLAERVDGELVHAGGASWDDLPPVEVLLAPEPGDVDGQPWAAPTLDPHDEDGYDPDHNPATGERTRWGLNAEGMCRAWGRVVYRQRRGELDPGGLGKPGMWRSQLDASIDIARHLACVRGEVEDRPPTIDEQMASAVEATEGFIDAEPFLVDRYVTRGEFHFEPRPQVVLFLAQLTEDWPWGFLPDRYASLTRGEQVRVVERDVLQAWERGRKRSA